jgi:hypothetical protein
MQDVVSSFIPFPNIYWWLQATEYGVVCFDKAEHFQKISYRNRYYITGANGLIQLSIPLQQGREQRNLMDRVGISYGENWQVQQWRTLVSVYNRSPYFQHYEPSLQQLFEKPYHLLHDFSRASIEWLALQLKATIEIKVTDTFVREYENSVDLRSMKPGIEKQAMQGLPYYQLFNERNGFLPNLSMLDLLFAEGPHAMQWIKSHKELVNSWGL